MDLKEETLLPDISQQVLNGTTQENGNTQKLWII